MIGIVSYLLINFWFTRIQANKAAILALTMNRVGDTGVSIGFFAMFAIFGSIDYATVFSLSQYMNETAITLIGLLLLTGAMAKSSQIPLHSWLPGSMEGRRCNFFIIIFTVCTFLFFVYFFINFNFISYYLLDIISYYADIYNFNFIILSCVVLPVHLGRDKKGRFKRKNIPPVSLPLPDKLQEAMVGQLLGDGHLRFN